MSDHVLLLGHGTVDNLEDLPAFLANIRHGRPSPPELVQEIRRRYELIGGSPLLRISHELARARCTWPCVFGTPSPKTCSARFRARDAARCASYRSLRTAAMSTRARCSGSPMRNARRGSSRPSCAVLRTGAE